MIDSVYSPLDQAILLRKQSEIMTLATLSDKQLETLWRRAENFSSDGFIRTQTTRLISAPLTIFPNTWNCFSTFG